MSELERSFINLQRVFDAVVMLLIEKEILSEIEVQNQILEALEVDDE